jgi:predicted neutral ceramidase superfamily lipid hydrolase
MIYSGMKTKNKKSFLNMDERNKTIAYKVIAAMYILTIIAMQGIVLYRQFALKQEMGNFEDIAIIMTINSLFLISALLYFGAIQIRRLKIKSILLIYVVFVVLGALFTYAKYNIFQTPGLSIEQLLEKLIIIISIIGVIMGFWILLAYMSKKRIDKEIE